MGYIDWSITVPLQMIEFYLILSAVQPNITAAMFWRLLLGTVVMLAFGYCGEAGFVNAWLSFVAGMAGWGYILYEIFMGEAGSVAASGEKVSENVKTSFATIRFIVTVGWSIYPLGYFFGYLMGSVNDDALNLVYNLADFVTRSRSVLPSGVPPRRTPGRRRPTGHHCSVESRGLGTFRSACMN